MVWFEAQLVQSVVTELRGFGRSWGSKMGFMQ